MTARRGRSGSSARARRLIVAAVVAVCPASPALAQIVRIDAGTSSIYDASGATVQVDNGAWSVSVGAGAILGQPASTFLVRRHDGVRTLSFGDDRLVVGSPTDAGDRTVLVAVRGAGIATTTGPWKLTAFAGSASSELGAPFLHGASYQAPLGALLLDRPLGPGRLFFSRTVISDRVTSTSGLRWQARPDLVVAAAAGVVANAASASARATLKRSWLDLDAAVTRASAWGAPTGVDSLDELTPGRTSVTAAIHPDESWSLRAARQDFAATAGPIVTLPAATVTRVSGDWQGGGFRLTGAFATSQTPTFSNEATSFGVGHAIAGNADAQGDVYIGRSGDAPGTTSVTVTTRQPFGPHLNLLEFFTEAGGHPSLSLGATVLTSAMSITAGYQTVFTPLRPGGPFVRALMVDVRTYAPGGFALDLGTHVAPDGSVRYTVSATRVLARGGDDTSRPITLAPYVVRGRVTDEDGRPVARAVVQVDREVMITDDSGRFALHVAKRRACALSVLLDEFPAPGPYEVVEAPTSLQPANDREAVEAEIRVRRRN